MLSRDQAAIEGGEETGRALGREFHFICSQNRQRCHWSQTAGVSFKRNDFVAKSEAVSLFRDWPGIRVFPIKLLEWKLSRGLTLLNRLTFENGMARQSRFLSLSVNSIKSEAHAAVGSFSVAPRNCDYVVVSKSDRVAHLWFSTLEFVFNPPLQLVVGDI